jgi:hypothetical protein
MPRAAGMAGEEDVMRKDATATIRSTAAAAAPIRRHRPTGTPGVATRPQLQARHRDLVKRAPPEIGNGTHKEEVRSGS